MIYLISGTDIKKTRFEANKLANSLLNKKPNSNIFKLNEENFSLEKIEELSESSGLFESKYIIILDNLISGSKENKDILVSLLEELSESENIFILLDGKVNTGDLKKIEKTAKQVWLFNKKEIKESFNVFALADAIGRIDKKSAWRVLVEARDAGVTNEELYGIVFWQFKVIAISNNFSLEDSGEKPFTYNKAKNFSKNFKEGELRKKFLEFLDIYHCSRRGELDFEDSLERFVLNI